MSEKHYPETNQTVDELLDSNAPDPGAESLDDHHEYRVLANPYERMNYVHLTDELISRLDGTEGEPPDYVIYLDKSARPVNWMARELWDTLAAKDENGDPVKRPQSLFVNIDGRGGEQPDGKPKDSPDAIANLRALFSIDTPLKGQEVMDTPSYLDGKRVLILDEIQVSGDTLRKAREYLSAAFPSAKFDTHAWMDATPPSPVAMPEDNVRWYERTNNRYRAVLDAVEPERAEELKGSDPRIERGWDWLAKTPPKLSKETTELLSDIEAMAEDVRTGRLPYIPAYDRPDYDERVHQFNGITNEELQRLIQWTKQSFWPNYSHASALTDKTGPLNPELAEQFGWDEARLKAQRRGNRPPSRNEYHATIVRGEAADAAASYAQRIGFLGKSALQQQTTA